MKGWYKTVSKVTNEQLQKAKDVFVGKAAPIEVRGHAVTF